MVGQLTGTMPTEQQIADQATSTQSVVNPPSRKMYLGLNTQDRVAIGDAEALMKQYYGGVDSTTTRYNRSQGGATALRNVEAALKAARP